MSSLFFRRHYLWLAEWVAKQLDAGTLDEQGVIALMNALNADNHNFKPTTFWSAVQDERVSIKIVQSKQTQRGV